MNLESINTSEAPPTDTSKIKCEQIKSHLESYLLRNSNLSLQSLENRTGVPVSSLRRITNLTGNPSSESVIKIYRALGLDQELEKYLEMYHPEIAALMSAQVRKRELDYVQKKEADYFTSESSFLIMNMAHTVSGVTEDDIKLQYGLNGVFKLFELIKEGFLIKREDGRIVGKNKKWKLSYKDTLTSVILAVKQYRLEEAGNFNNFINYQTESLSLEGLQVLREVEKEQANYRSERVFRNKALQGNYPAFTATVSSTFMPYNQTSEELQ